MEINLPDSIQILLTKFDKIEAELKESNRLRSIDLTTEETVLYDVKSISKMISSGKDKNIHSQTVLRWFQSGELRNLNMGGKIYMTNRACLKEFLSAKPRFRFTIE